MADSALATSEADSAAEPGARIVTISDSAAKRVAFLRGQEGDESLMLRIAVSGGGCSGFQYGFSFDNQRNDDDHLFEHQGVGVVMFVIPALKLMDRPLSSSAVPLAESTTQ